MHSDVLLALAVGWLALIALSLVTAIVWMIGSVRETLFCGECGKFTDDLTDDDICHNCACSLAGKDFAHD